MYGLQVDFCKLNDTFLQQSKKILKDKYRIDIDTISIETNPDKCFVLKYKNESITIPIEPYDDCYRESNEAFKSIVRTMIDTFPEDFI